MAEFRRSFHTIDRNNTGKITMEDLRAYMHRMNYKESFVAKWMKLFKPNEEGVITYENYCNTLGLIPRRPESVGSDISEATIPETPPIEPHSSAEDSETTHSNNAVTEVIDQQAVEATVSQTQTFPKDSSPSQERKLEKKTKKSPRTAKHKPSSASEGLLLSDSTDTSKESEIEHTQCADLTESVSMEPSVVLTLPSQVDTSMLLDQPSETSSKTKAEVEFSDNAALEFRQPSSSGLQVHTTFGDSPVGIPVFGETVESEDTTTITSVVKSSKRKRSTSKSKEKRKQKAQKIHSEPDRDKKSTEEIPTSEAPPTTELLSEMVDTNSSTLESAEVRPSYQLPVFQVPDQSTTSDVTPEHNAVPVEKEETDQQIRDISLEEQSREEQSKGDSEEKREHENEVPSTLADNENIVYEDSAMFASARSAVLGPETMDIVDVPVISSEVTECEYSIDQPVTSLDANEILVNVTESNGVEKAEHAVDLKPTKGKAKRRGKHKVDGSLSVSESESPHSDERPSVAASTTATNMEFELMSTDDHITMAQVGSEKAEVPRPKSPTGLISDEHYISSDIPAEDRDPSEMEQTMSGRPKVHKSKQLKTKSKGKGKNKGEVLPSACESENSSHEEVLTAHPPTEDVEEQKTEMYESAGDVPPPYHLLTVSSLGDVSSSLESSKHPEELEFPEGTSTEQGIPKKKHRKATKSRGNGEQNEGVLCATPDSEKFSLEEVSTVMDLPAIDKETTGLLEFSEPTTFPNESVTSLTLSDLPSDHKPKRKRKGKNKGDILLSASETEKSGPEDVSAITDSSVSTQRLADIETEQKPAARLELAERPFPLYESPTDLTVDTHTTRDDVPLDSIPPNPDFGDTNEWKYPKTKGKGKPKQATSLECETNEAREIPASPILMDLRSDDEGSHTAVQLEVAEESASVHHLPDQPTSDIPADIPTDDFFKVEVSESLKTTGTEQKHRTKKRAGMKGERKEEHTENAPCTVHESEPGSSEEISSAAATSMTEMAPGVLDMPHDHKKPRGRKRSKSLPKQHSQEEKSGPCPGSESLMGPPLEMEVLQTELSGKSDKTKALEREYRNGSLITSKNKKDKAKIIQPQADVKTDTSSQPSTGFSVSETQHEAFMTQAYPGEKGSEGVSKRKRKTNQPIHTEANSRSKAPKTKPSRTDEGAGPSVQRSAVTGTTSTVNDESVSALEDATRGQLEESVCYPGRPTSPKEVNPDALFSRIPFWMRIRKKQSVIRRRRLMRKIDMKRKRAVRREQLTDDAVSQTATHRFPRSFETQPHPEKGKSQIRKRRRAVERLVQYRADQVNRVQRPKTKKKAKRRLTALDRWKVRSSLRKRGVIVILLGGRHRGKRVVSLGRQKSTGLLLVTGPFRYNGCPLRRVHPNMVLATKTRVDLGKFKVPLRVHSKEYFARKKLDKKHDLDVQLGLSGTPDATESKRFVPSEDRKEDQRIIDEEVCKCIKAHEDSRMLIKYLRSLFSLSKHDKPHAMQF